MENPFSHIGRMHKHTCNFFRVCCFLFMPPVLLPVWHWLVSSALQKADKDTALIRLAMPHHSLSSTYRLLLLHFKLFSYMLNIPWRKILMNETAQRLFLIYNLLKSTCHTGLNWQLLSSQVFWPLTATFLSCLSTLTLLFCPQGPDSNGLKEEMVLFHSFRFHLEALAGLRFPSTSKSDNTIK